jgi:hypothetical protein
MWNNGQPLTFRMKWNPFNNDIPWTTYTSHPLLWRKGKFFEWNALCCDVDSFSELLGIWTVSIVRNSRS